MGLWSSLVIAAGALSNLYYKQVCYDGLGCYNNEKPFNNAGAILPESPAKIQLSFLLYTQNYSDLPQTLTRDPKRILDSRYDGSKRTKFIIHGYRDDGRDRWVQRMKSAILTKDDVNVIIVDWEKGANAGSYNQVAANARLVGAMIAQLVTSLKSTANASFVSMHLIGHSLGAHIAGYTGTRVRGLGRITGLDPANLGFEKKDRRVRLDRRDAKFVDVIHTDGKPFTKIGFGIRHRLGHADFYPNGGRNQPGCPKKGKHIFKLFTGKFKDFMRGIGCSHGRAVEYFTESITASCRFTAYPCSSEENFKKGKCLCSDKCGRMGYFAHLGHRNGRFELRTGSKKPFCVD